MQQVITSSSGNEICFNPKSFKGGAYLIGYYYPRAMVHDINILGDVKTYMSIYTLEVNRPASTFNDLCARFYRLLGKSIFIKHKHQDKTAIFIPLHYEGHYFYLYDYKGDSCFHLGGTDESKHLIQQLAADLDDIIRNIRPKKFKHKSCYAGAYYQYK